MLKFAGGHDGSFLVETEKFCRAHGSSTKSLGPALWEVLAADVKGRTDQHVWVRETKPSMLCNLKKWTLVPTTMNIKCDTEPAPDHYFYFEPHGDLPQRRWRIRLCHTVLVCGDNVQS